MPSESDLRDSLRDGNPPSGEIDITAVLSRARARRRPRVALVGAGAVLAVAAIVVPVSVSGLTQGGAGGSALSDQAPTVESAQGTAADNSATGMDPSKRAPASRLNLCTGALAEVAPAASGLVLNVTPVDAAATATAIPATVTLTNSGAARVTGSTADSPSLTFSRDGITLWHSNGPVDAVGLPIDLAPGASMTFPATFEPAVCGTDDDLAESFRTDLPPAGPGTYGLSAAMDVNLDVAADTPDAAIELVTGPVAVVTLH